MALFKCPECGKEISDKAKICPNCGYPVTPKVIEDKMHWKRKFLGGLSIILLIIAVIIIGVLSGKNLSATDLAVKNSYKEVKSMLLDPKSIIVYECYCHDYTQDENSEITSNIDEKSQKEIMVYMHYGAKNTNGGISEEEMVIACDKSGKVLESMNRDEYNDCLEQKKDMSLNMIMYWGEVAFQDLKKAITGESSDFYVVYDQETIEGL